MPVNADLAALQDIDRALDERRMALQQIGLRMAEGGPLHEAREAVRASEQRLSDLDTRQREANRLADAAWARFEAEERRLYSGSIANPKDLSALQHEVETLKRQRDERDEVVLALIVEAEEAGERHARAQEQLQQIQTERTALVEELRGRRTEVEKAIADLEAKQKAQTARIPPDALALYQGLRRRRQGRAVARIERGSCGGCRITLPVETVGRARRSAALVQCPSCERILFDS